MAKPHSDLGLNHGTAQFFAKTYESYTVQKQFSYPSINSIGAQAVKI
jgi:hypothetical protein